MKYKEDLDEVSKFKLLEEDLKKGKEFFNKKIYDVYKQELEENVSNILIEKESDFLLNFVSKMKLILEEMYSNEAYEVKEFLQVVREIEKYFYDNVYKKIHTFLKMEYQEYEKSLKNVRSIIIYLKSYRKHCTENDTALHICKAKFLPIFDENKNISFVICIGCKSVYFANLILMYCPECNVEYYSCHMTNLDKNFQPATWDNYHCGALVNDQMRCIKCRDLFYLDIKSNNLICIKCRFEASPNSILWNCILCNKDFRSNAKIYNPMEFKIVKLAIKNALLYKLPSKPPEINCCEVDIVKMEFFHKNECRGLIYNWEMSGKKIIVCSLCKMMTNFDKFLWTCPMCLNRFKCQENPQPDCLSSRNLNKEGEIKKFNPISQNNRYSGRNLERTKENENKNLRPKISFSLDRGNSNNFIDEDGNLLKNNINNQLKFSKMKTSQTPLTASQKVLDLNKEDNNLTNNSTNFNGTKVNTIFKKSLLTKKDENKVNVDYKNLQSKISFSDYNNLRLNLKNSPPNLNKPDLIESAYKKPYNIGSIALKINQISGQKDALNSPLILSNNPNSFVNIKNSLLVSKNQSPNLNIEVDDAVNKVTNQKFDIGENSPYKIHDSKLVTKNSNTPWVSNVTIKENFSKNNYFENEATVGGGLVYLNSSPRNTDDEEVISNFITNENNNNKLPKFSFNQTSNDKKTQETRRFKEIDIENYNILTQIGEGTFGKIYLVEDKNKNLYSMKKIFASDDAELQTFQLEYELIYQSKHDNILSIIGMCTRQLDKTTIALYILMEVGITDWEKEIKSRQSLKKNYSEKELIDILKQLVSALAFLQRINISHRDIKPQNILIFKNSIYKIADFGEAKQINKKDDNKQLNTLRGTELYMSPLLFNALRNNQNDIKHNIFKSDVYSLAYCIIYAATLNLYALYEFRKISDNKSLFKLLERNFKKKMSDKFIYLLNKMLEINEINRFNFLELENFLKDY